MSVLTVYLKDVPVGRLEDTAAGLRFAYSSDYVAQPRPEPLSYALPVTVEPYGGAAVESYFSNLLPDDYIRTRLGQILQIPRENTFALLEAFRRRLRRCHCALSRGSWTRKSGIAAVS